MIRNGESAAAEEPYEPVPLTKAEAVALILCAAEAFRGGELTKDIEAAAVAAIEKLNGVFHLEIHKTRP